MGSGLENLDVTTLTRLRLARALIKDGQYDEARLILVRLKHPLAQEWMRKLDKIDPLPPEPAEGITTFAMGLFGGVIGTLVGGGAWAALSALLQVNINAAIIAIGILIGAMVSGFSGRHDGIIRIMAMAFAPLSILFARLGQFVLEAGSSTRLLDPAVLNRLDEFIVLIRDEVQQDYASINLAWVALTMIAAWLVASLGRSRETTEQEGNT